MSYLLDGLSSHVCQEMVFQRRVVSKSPKWREWRHPTSTMAVSWMQFTERRLPYDIHLLVRKGDRAAAHSWTAATFLRSDLWKGESEEVPTSLCVDLPCWSMSALFSHGTNTILLLRQARIYEALCRDGVRVRMGLWRHMRSFDVLRYTSMCSILS